MMLEPGDVLVFDARLCHGGGAGLRQGQGPEALVGVSFAAHVYGGDGIQAWDLVNSARCGLLPDKEMLAEATGGGKEADEKEGDRMNEEFRERRRREEEIRGAAEVQREVAQVGAGHVAVGPGI